MSVSYYEIILRNSPTDIVLQLIRRNRPCIPLRFILRFHFHDNLWVTYKSELLTALKLFSI